MRSHGQKPLGAKVPQVVPGALFFLSFRAKKHLVFHSSAAPLCEPQHRKWGQPESSLEKHISDPNKNANANLPSLL